MGFTKQRPVNSKWKQIFYGLTRSRRSKEVLASIAEKGAHAAGWLGHRTKQRDHCNRLHALHVLAHSIDQHCSMQRKHKTIRHKNHTRVVQEMAANRHYRWVKSHLEQIKQKRLIRKNMLADRGPHYTPSGAHLGKKV